MYSLLLSLFLLPLPSLSPTPAAADTALNEVCVRSPEGACVEIDVGQSSGSGTVIWYEDGYSIILTARHVTKIKGEMTVVHKGKTYAAVRGMESATADLAVVWVKAKLPTADVAAVEPKVGDDLHHWGTTTGAATGKALHYRVYPEYGRALRSDYRVDPGDSGSGVFNADNELVAVNIAYEEDYVTKERMWSVAMAGDAVRGFLADYAAALDPRLLAAYKAEFGRRTQPKSQPPCPDGRCPLKSQPPCPDGRCPPNTFNPFQPRR